jgi:hypothetical protein
MAGKVFFSVSMSLDGFSAPESMQGILATPEQREQDPRLERWIAQWMELQAWIFPQRFFRENLNLGAGGEEGRHPPVRRRGRGQGRAGAGPFGAVAAGDAPDLRGAPTVAAPPLHPSTHGALA